MVYEGTFWLDASNGHESKSEVVIKDVPSNFGLLTLNSTVSRIDQEKSDK